jgi:hypothetical protein
MIRFVTSFVIAFFLSPVFAATGETERSDHEQLQSALGWLEGTWEDAEGLRFFKWELRGQILTWTPADPDAAKGIFYWDRADRKVKVICFSADGWHISGVLESGADKQVTLTVVNVLPSGKKVNASLVYALKDNGTLFVEMKVVPGQDTGGVTLDRVWNLKKAK